MTSPWRPPDSPDPSTAPAELTDVEEPCHVDITVPHMARVYDYLLGGEDNFAVDREHAEFVCAALPGGIETARANVRANRAFLREAVRYLAADLGARQFLDIGTGIPNVDNVHAVAQQTAPDARIVYVDHDPVVLAHAHQLLRSTPEGATAYIDADLRNPDKILDQATQTLDLTTPVVVMLVGILHYLPDEDEPYRIVTTLLDAVAPGSHLVVSHLASDIQPEQMADLANRHNQPRATGSPTQNAPAETVVLRNRDQTTAFFDGLDLLHPGVATVDQWHPPRTTPPPTTPGHSTVPIYGGIARKLTSAP